MTTSSVPLDPPARRRFTTAVNRRWRLAVRTGDLPRINALLASHAVELQNRTGIDGEEPHAALDLAVISRTPEVVRRILDVGAQVNEASDLGVTALHIAAVRAVTPVIPLLLAAGANVTAQDVNGDTPLINAAGAGVPEPVALLLAAGAPVNQRGHRQRTALHRAIGRTRNPDVVDQLLAAGANPLLVDDEHRHAVHALCQGEGGARGLRVLDTVIVWAQAQGQPWLTVDELGWTPLHLAIAEDVPTMVTALLQRGVPLDLPTADGTLPLDLAQRYGAHRAQAVLVEALVARERLALTQGLDAIPVDTTVRGVRRL